MKPKYKVGDKVRILKNLDVNISSVSEFLGKYCVVEKVTIFVRNETDTRYNDIEYQLRLNDRVEPFFEYELDYRIKSKVTDLDTKMHISNSITGILTNLVKNQKVLDSDIVDAIDDNFDDLF